ncbi:MAG: hypothetical protein GX997_09245 [Bacteroidales bacterium]|nr:hypothetical protein [Bacteroidales bacterium]
MTVARDKYIGPAECPATDVKCSPAVGFMIPAIMSGSIFHSPACAFEITGMIY